jgi:hypothetical protein
MLDYYGPGEVYGMYDQGRIGYITGKDRRIATDLRGFVPSLYIIAQPHIS